MKALETTKLRNETTDKLRIQYDTLLSLVASTQSAQEIIEPILNSIYDQLEYITSSHIYMFNFKGGGWNSISAMDKEQAIQIYEAEQYLTNFRKRYKQEGEEK